MSAQKICPLEAKKKSGNCFPINGETLISFFTYQVIPEHLSWKSERKSTRKESSNICHLMRSRFETGKMPSLAKDLADICCCNICGEAYDEGRQAPRLLSCSHTVCHSCIKNIVKSGRVKCPFDNREFSLPPQGLFPLNRFVLETLGKLNDLGEASIASKECVECKREAASVICATCKSQLCGACESKVHTGQDGHSVHPWSARCLECEAAAATFNCVDCQARLCSTCDGILHSFKVLNKHSRTAWTDPEQKARAAPTSSPSLDSQPQEDGKWMCWERDPQLPALVHLTNSDRSVHLDKQADNNTVRMLTDRTWSTGRHMVNIKLESTRGRDKLHKEEVYLGVCPYPAQDRSGLLGYKGVGWSLSLYEGAKCHGGQGDRSVFNYSPSLPDKLLDGDRIGILLDCERGELEFFHNDKSLGVAFDNIDTPVRVAITATHTLRLTLETPAQVPKESVYKEAALQSELYSAAPQDNHALAPNTLELALQQLAAQYSGAQEPQLIDEPPEDDEKCILVAQHPDHFLTYRPAPFQPQPATQPQPTAPTSFRQAFGAALGMSLRSMSSSSSSSQSHSHSSPSSSRTPQPQPPQPTQPRTQAQAATEMQSVEPAASPRCVMCRNTPQGGYWECSPCSLRVCTACVNAGRVTVTPATLFRSTGFRLAVLRRGGRQVTLGRRAGPTATERVTGNQVWAEGRHMVTVRLDSNVGKQMLSNEELYFGVQPEPSRANGLLGYTGDGHALSLFEGAKCWGGRQAASVFRYAPQLPQQVQSGDTISCLVDCDQKLVEYFHNGRSLGVAFDNLETPCRFAMTATSSITATIVPNPGGKLPEENYWDPEALDMKLNNAPSDSAATPMDESLYALMAMMHAHQRAQTDTVADNAQQRMDTDT
eukprot:g7744.t1